MYRMHSPPGHRDRTTRGGQRRHAPARVGGGRFTLIELLVVVAIIAILIAMLLPVLSRAKEASKRSVCMSQLKQWHLVLELFADEHEGGYPQLYTVYIDFHGNAVLMPSRISINGPSSPPYNYPAGSDGRNGQARFVFEKYGLAKEQLFCPSRPGGFPPYQEPFTDYDRGQDNPYQCWGEPWNCVQDIGYTIVAGFSDPNNEGEFLRKAFRKNSC